MNTLKAYGSEESSSDDDTPNLNTDTKEDKNQSDIDYFNLYDERDDWMTEPPCKLIKEETLHQHNEIEIPNTEFWCQQNVHIEQINTNDKSHDNSQKNENSSQVPSAKAYLNNSAMKFVAHKHADQSTRYIPGGNSSGSGKSFINTNNSKTVSQPVEQRKLYYVHSKITPNLHKKIQNIISPCKCEEKIFAHEGVTNKVKWNNSSYSHLFLSVSMDTTIKIWNIWSQLDPCLKVLNVHSKAVKDAEWSLCGKKILSCSYDRKAIVTDVESGKEVSKFEHSTYVSCGKFHPVSPDIVVTGGNNCLQAWDCRIPQSPCKEYIYKDKYGQVQDVLFSRDSKEFYTCNDMVSRDSADRNIMVWDYSSGVVLSNQVYQERYTCTKLKLHPTEGHLLAQSQGNYIALFSTNKPFKMNKSKRFEGHKILGYKIGFDITPDGSTVYSGSTDGKIYCYNYNTGKQFRTLNTGLDICMDVDFHPVLPSTLLCCGWNGVIQVWH